MKMFLNIIVIFLIIVGCSALPEKGKSGKKKHKGKIYEAKGGESLLDLAAKWRVDIDDILLENPSLTSTTLKKGDRVFLPYSLRKGLQQEKKVRKWSLSMRRAFSAFGFDLPLLGYFSLPPGGVRDRHPLAFEITHPMQREVRSIAEGRVALIFKEQQEEAGVSIIIEHPGSFFSCYSPLESVERSPGEWVEKGAVLGKAGMLGFPKSEGIRLHLFSLCCYPIGGLSRKHL